MGSGISKSSTASQPIAKTSVNELVPKIKRKSKAASEEKEVIPKVDISFADFPTHVNLRQANAIYHEKICNSVPRDEEGKLRPFPSYRKKADIFDPRKFEKLDKYAEQVHVHI